MTLKTRKQLDHQSAREKQFRREQPAKYWYQNLKGNAKARGVEFTLTQDDFDEFVQVTHCPVLGIELSHVPVDGVHHSKANRASLDRFDSSKGYTKDNVWVISSRANMLKKDATIEELQRLALAVTKRSIEHGNTHRPKV